MILSVLFPPVLFFVQESSWTIKAAEAVDDCLESFMGIRDNELGKHKYYCASGYFFMLVG